jgi:hypothetical protein
MGKQDLPMIGVVEKSIASVYKQDKKKKKAKRSKSMMFGRDEANVDGDVIVFNG